MLNLRQLEVFRAVMAAGSLTAAGRHLQMSQPAVSKAVRRMEDVLGLKLFVRSGGRARPTPEATSLYREVAKVFHNVRVMERYAHDLKAAQSGVLTLACTPTLSCSFVAEAIARFRRDRPNVRVWLNTTTTGETLELAATGQIDIGIIYTPGNHPGVEVLPLYETEIVCVMRRDHPLAGLSVIRPSDLAGQAIVTNVRNEPMHDLIETAFSRGDLDRRVMVGTNNTVTACSLVQAGSGVALVEPMGIAELFPNMVQRRFRPRVAITPRTVQPRGLPMSRTAAAYLEILKECAADNWVRGEAILDGQ